LAFKMLTGELPFVGDTDAQTFMARLTGELRPLAEARPDLVWPPDLQMAMDRGLAQSPDDRYQTAEDFARAFDRATRWTDVPVPATPGPSARENASRSAAVSHDASIGRALPTADTRKPPVGKTRAGFTWRHAAFPLALVIALAAGVTVGSVRWRTALRPPANTHVDSVVHLDSSPHQTPPKAPPDFDAARALARLAQLSDPKTVTDSSAHRVLYAVPRLLPYFTTRQDSVQALYHAIEARAALNDSAGACRALRELRPRAVGTRFAPGVNALATVMSCGR
jgi:hypothetical protein